MTKRASLLYECKCELGEGALWHDGRKSFFWVDIEKNTVYEMNWYTRETNTYTLPFRVSLIIPESTNESVILAVQGAIVRLNLYTGNLTHLASLEKNIPNNRPNDGGCDPQGRIWIGTMDIHARENCGALYCLGHDMIPRKTIRDITIPNGLAWTADRTIMYHVDSAKNVVNSYRFNESTGDIAFENAVVNAPEDTGSPDGMCIDDNGNLWIAHWGGFAVYCWNPETGSIIDKIDVPAPNVSSCVFGGNNLDELLITTARQGLDEDQLNQYPASGSVFVSKAGVRGTTRFSFRKAPNEAL